MQKIVIKHLKKDSMSKWIIISIIIVTTTITGYNYVYQGHRTIENETAEFVVSTQEIANQFFENIKASEQKYLNKTIEVSGIISEIDTKEITLDDKVYCQFLEAINASVAENIKIKGRVIGYDDLLEQIKLDQCIIINN